MRRFIFPVLVFLSFSIQPVAGQDIIQMLSDSTAASETTVDPVDSSTLVKPADLIIAFEEVTQLMRDISTRLASDFKTSAIEQAYESEVDNIKNYLLIGERSQDNASLSNIDDMIIIFERLSGEVSTWQTSLIDYSRELSDAKIELLRSRERLTVDLLGMSKESEDYYTARFGPLYAQADSVEKQIDDRLAVILDLEYRISKDYVSLQNRIEGLKSMRRDYWVRILQPEDFSWSEVLDKPEISQRSFKTQFSETMWRIVTFFLEEHSGNTFFLALITIGFYMLLRHLKKLDEAKKDEEERYPLLYAYPLSQALLIGGLLFPVIYPPTTTLMYDFALLCTYIPFLWILYHILEKGLFQKYLLFFVFFLALKLVNLSANYSIFTHGFILACGVVFLLTLLGYTIRKKVKIRFRYVVTFNWMLRILLVVGILFVLTKRLTLGRLLINGTGETIAISLVLIFIANWLDRLMGFIKAQPYVQRLASSKAEINDYFDTVNKRIYLVLFFLFIVAILRDFTILGPVKDAITEFFMVTRKIGELEYNIMGLFLFFLVIYLSTKISATIKFFTEDKAYFKNKKKTANLSMMVRFFLVIGGFLLALVVSGIPLDKITIILGALSVGIGFGLQNIVNNLISGIILIFERPIQSGDLVELQQYMGVVKDIGIRSSIIRTYDGAEIIVPNGNLISQEVINWTLSNQHRRIEVKVGVAYGTDTEKVAEILTPLIVEHERVLKLPQPLILFDGFGDSSLNFRLLFWTSDIDNWMRTRSEITHLVNKALNENKIEIPFPQRDLHIRTWDDKKAIVPQAANGITKPTTKKGRSPQTK